MAQSLAAIKIDGIISIIGFVGGAGKGDHPGFLDALTKMCIVRGLLVGSRVQFEDMVSLSFASVRMSKMGGADVCVCVCRIVPLRLTRSNRLLTRRCLGWMI